MFTYRHSHNLTSLWKFCNRLWYLIRSYKCHTLICDISQPRLWQSTFSGVKYRFLGCDISHCKVWHTHNIRLDGSSKTEDKQMSRRGLLCDNKHSIFQISCAVTIDLVASHLWTKYFAPWQDSMQNKTCPAAIFRWQIIVHCEDKKESGLIWLNIGSPG